MSKYIYYTGTSKMIPQVWNVNKKKTTLSLLKI